MFGGLSGRFLLQAPRPLPSCPGRRAGDTPNHLEQQVRPTRRSLAHIDARLLTSSKPIFTCARAYVTSRNRAELVQVLLKICEDAADLVWAA